MSRARHHAAGGDIPFCRPPRRVTRLIEGREVLRCHVRWMLPRLAEEFNLRLCREVAPAVCPLYDRTERPQFLVHRCRRNAGADVGSFRLQVPGIGPACCDVVRERLGLQAAHLDRLHDPLKVVDRDQRAFAS